MRRNITPYCEPIKTGIRDDGDVLVLDVGS